MTRSRPGATCSRSEMPLRHRRRRPGRRCRPTPCPRWRSLGRSNVGKSSLVNALTGRNALARVSHTPGRTRQINFFELGARLMLVDLPGYGYAAAPKREIARWSRLMPLYLKGRAGLQARAAADRRAPRHQARRPRVHGALDGAAVSYPVVLTKCDKVEPASSRRGSPRRRRSSPSTPPPIRASISPARMTAPASPSCARALAALAARRASTLDCAAP